MTLQDIFDHLTYGELSMMHIGGISEAGITEENRHRIITHVSLGLTALHKRFFLRKGETDVYVLPALHSYTINEPDLFKVERVLDGDGEEVLIGDGGEYSVSMLNMTTISVPLSLRMTGKPLKVIYRADHPKLDKREANREPEKVNIELPASHLEALLYFIASRMFNPMGSTESTHGYHDGNNYAQKYENACRMLENQGMQISESVEQTKFQRNGWI